MDRKTTLFCLIFAVLVTSVAVQIPLHNRLVVFSDEGLIFDFAQGILNGEVPFRDMPSYVLPGLFYVLALLYKVFGVSYLISRYAMAVVFSATMPAMTHFLLHGLRIVS